MTTNVKTIDASILFTTTPALGLPKCNSDYHLRMLDLEAVFFPVATPGGRKFPALEERRKKAGVTRYKSH